MKHMQVFFDREGDLLELRFGKPVASYYEDLGQDTFARRSERTGKIVGYALFNVQKKKALRNLKLVLPA
jgi:hypothetical protein